MPLNIECCSQRNRWLQYRCGNVKHVHLQVLGGATRPPKRPGPPGQRPKPFQKVPATMPLRRWSDGPGRLYGTRWLTGLAVTRHSPCKTRPPCLSAGLKPHPHSSVSLCIGILEQPSSQLHKFTRSVQQIITTQNQLLCVLPWLTWCEYLQAVKYLCCR